MKFFATISILLLAISVFGWTDDKDLPASQLELVNTERAFAKLAVERGVTESFIAYFAEDGIGFNPHPFKVQETFKKRQAQTTGRRFILNWAPAFGDVAQAGDLGWNTGPTVVEDTSAEKSPTRHGMFFSVWKKQSDGSWRVVLDLGADTPAAVVPLDAPFTTSFRKSKQPAAPVDIEKANAVLLDLEREFLATAKSANAAQAYKAKLSDDARVHRPDVMPVVGKDALREWVGKQTMTLTGAPIKSDVSRSGDLGYVYGSYELGGDKPEKGYYARVWKRDEKGVWHIVMDTVNPLPAGMAIAGTAPAPTAASLSKKAEEYYLAQRWADAAAAYQEIVKENPNSAEAWHRLGTSQIGLKQYADAIKNLEQAIKSGGTGALDYYNLACAYALSGEKDKALDNLEKAISAGFTERQQYQNDTDLDSLRDTERFKELMKRLP